MSLESWPLMDFRTAQIGPKTARTGLMATRVGGTAARMGLIAARADNRGTNLSILQLKHVRAASAVHLPARAV